MLRSDTRNVHVGPCRVYYDGVDLGFTKGGVDVEVSTETFKTEVDQFGKTPISEVISARMLKVTVPMAETDLDRLFLVMPNSKVVTAGGATATGTFTVATNPTDGHVITVNGKTWTFKTTVAAQQQVLIGATAAATATNLAAALNASQDPKIAIAQYAAASSVVTATYNVAGVEGNDFALATTQSSVTVSGTNLTGGIDVTAKRIDVGDGVGVNLLASAKELRLHPTDRLEGDTQDDFVIPLAATAGGMKFAYKTEDVRVFNCEFSGFPDLNSVVADGSGRPRLFYMGN